MTISSGRGGVARRALPHPRARVSREGVAGAGALPGRDPRKTGRRAQIGTVLHRAGAGRAPGAGGVTAKSPGRGRAGRRGAREEGAKPSVFAERGPNREVRGPWGAGRAGGRGLRGEARGGAPSDGGRRRGSKTCDVRRRDGMRTTGGRRREACDGRCRDEMRRAERRGPQEGRRAPPGEGGALLPVRRLGGRNLRPIRKTPTASTATLGATPHGGGSTPRGRSETEARGRAGGRRRRAERRAVAPSPTSPETPSQHRGRRR